jgi:hypothetical protein
MPSIHAAYPMLICLFFWEERQYTEEGIHPRLHRRALRHRRGRGLALCGAHLFVRPQTPRSLANTPGAAAAQGRTRHSAGTQGATSWAFYASSMTLELCGEKDTSAHPTDGPPTFLGSQTAPDGTQVRVRLRQVQQRARRRKSYARCAAAGCSLLAALFTQDSGTHNTRQSH